MENAIFVKCISGSLKTSAAILWPNILNAMRYNGRIRDNSPSAHGDIGLHIRRSLSLLVTTQHSHLEQVTLAFSSLC